MSSPCTFPGCINNVWVKSLGLCSSHNTQRMRGVPLRPIRHRPKPITDLESLLSRAVPVGDCLVIPTGHDREDQRVTLYFERKAWLSHRLSFHLAKGDIPEGAVIHHMCGNGLCVNPEHLQLADQVDNILEMLSRRTFEARIRALEKEVSELKSRIQELEQVNIDA